MYENYVPPSSGYIYRQTMAFLAVIVAVLFLLFFVMLLRRRKRIKEDQAFERG